MAKVSMDKYPRHISSKLGFRTVKKRYYCFVELLESSYMMVSLRV